jgi:hypothetical protein
VTPFPYFTEARRAEIFDLIRPNVHSSVHSGKSITPFFRNIVCTTNECVCAYVNDTPDHDAANLQDGGGKHNHIVSGALYVLERLHVEEV